MITKRLVGSDVFGTTIVKTNEYMLLAKVGVENGSNLEEAVADIELIDDCLAMRRMFAVYGYSKSAMYTETGRLRKNSTYMDFISKRIDKAIENKKELL